MALDPRGVGDPGLTFLSKVGSMAIVAPVMELAMLSPALVNLSALIDDAKCYELIRQHRWPDGVRCPSCSASTVIRHGMMTLSAIGNATAASTAKHGLTT
jgi:hypothetical protein